MHKRFSSNAPALVVSMSLVLFATSPAELRIECRGNFQITVIAFLSHSDSPHPIAE